MPAYDAVEAREGCGASKHMQAQQDNLLSDHAVVGKGDLLLE